MKILQAIADFFRNLFGGKAANDPPIIDKPQIPKQDIPPSVVPVKDPSNVQPQVQPQTEVPVVKPDINTSPTTNDAGNQFVIKLVRYSVGAEDTLGRLYINNKLYCYTLEDQYRERKVAGDTCIPTGEYEIVFRNVGGMNDTYCIKYPDIHKGMLWLQNVPGFEYILIHIGNSEADTKGCILVGSHVVGENNTQKARQITGSKDAYYKVYPIVADYLEKGGKVMMKIVES